MENNINVLKQKNISIETKINELNYQLNLLNKKQSHLFEIEQNKINSLRSNKGKSYNYDIDLLEINIIKEKEIHSNGSEILDIKDGTIQYRLQKIESNKNKIQDFQRAILKNPENEKTFQEAIEKLLLENVELKNSLDRIESDLAFVKEQQKLKEKKIKKMKQTRKNLIDQFESDQLTKMYEIKKIDFSVIGKIKKEIELLESEKISNNESIEQIEIEIAQEEKIKELEERNRILKEEKYNNSNNNSNANRCVCNNSRRNSFRSNDYDNYVNSNFKPVKYFWDELPKEDDSFYYDDGSHGC